MKTTVDALVADRLGLPISFTRQELDKAQMRLLGEGLSHAVQNSNFYKKKFDSVAVDSVRQPSDLEKLPFTTADEIINDYNLFHCVSQSKVARIVTLHTTGSTGKPKRYAFTESDLQKTSDFFFQGMKNLVSYSDRVLVLMPYETEESVGELLIKALDAGGIYACGLWPPTDIEAVAQLIKSKKISSVVGLPQHLLALSEEVPKGQLKTMLLASDYAPQPLRVRIENYCGCKTFLHYGATESGLGGAVECECHNGLHMRESDLFYEVVDPDTGKQLSDGELGELVLTTLEREAMPLIRYRTGDFGSLKRVECSCGGITARLCNIYGRMQVATFSDGSKLSSQRLDDILFQVEGLLDYRAQLVHNHIDRLIIEYRAGKKRAGVAATIAQLLVTDPILSELLENGLLQLETVQQVDQFSPSHTLKRTILDAR